MTYGLKTNIGWTRFLCCAWLVVLAACGHAADGPSTTDATFTVEQLKDPETCKDCHPKQYQDWSGSMHAYATDDPLFVALNKRGQDAAQIGPFCVKCHAPMAVHEGMNDGSMDPASLAKPLRGVTCYFCHNVDNVLDTHDNPLHLADDTSMRGEYMDPVPNKAHHSLYSTFIDRDRSESASMCGACHDIVNKNNAHIERTFAEWQASVYAQSSLGTTCSQCHMKQSTSLVPIAEGPDVTGVRSRERHDHQFPGVDRAVTDFLEVDAQAASVQDLLNTELQSTLCVSGYPNMSGANIMVVLDNVAGGHQWPSGAAQDRRLWLEVAAYQNGNPVPIFQSGVVPDGSAPTALTDDPNLWLLRDCMFDPAGKETHNFWDAATIESNTLPAQLTFDPMNINFYKSHIYQNYPRATDKRLDVYPDRVTLRALLQPFPLDLFDDLFATPADHGLTADQVAAMRAKLAAPLVVGTPVEWTLANAADPVHGEMYVDSLHTPINCVMPTNLRASADKVPAKNHTMCSP
jgi:hypothetical protein